MVPALASLGAGSCLTECFPCSLVGSGRSFSALTVLPLLPTMTWSPSQLLQCGGAGAAAGLAPLALQPSPGQEKPCLLPRDCQCYSMKQGMAQQQWKGNKIVPIVRVSSRHNTRKRTGEKDQHWEHPFRKYCPVTRQDHCSHHKGTNELLPNSSPQKM